MKSNRNEKSQFANLKRLLAAFTMVWVLTLAGSAGLYLWKTYAMRQQLQGKTGEKWRKADLTAATVLRETDEVILDALAVTGAVGGVLVLLLGVAVRRCHQSGLGLLTASGLEWQQTRLRLQTELRDARNAEIDCRRERDELRTRLASLSRSYEVLQLEFSKRKRSEQEWTQQRQELARSKDVLELHVQARTQQLQKLQHQYEGILNSAGEGICGVDLEGRIGFANPAAARITGWSIEELVGAAEGKIFRKKGQDEPARESAGRNEAERIFSRKDGSVFFAEYVRTEISENERPAGAVIVFKDITERRNAELKLAQKAAELERSNAELEQFAFVASHDLQEPLRKIQAFGDRLKLKCQTLDLAEGRDYLERMQNAAARMQRLINDLLTFSRAIRSTQPFTAVDLNAVTKEVLCDLEVRIEERRAKVEVGNLPTIQADPTQIRQLVQNLVGNALKFQPPVGQPVVRISSRLLGSPKPVNGKAPDLPDQPPHGNGQNGGAAVTWELTFQDNGIGFDEKYRDKIFAVFQRLHGRGEYEGTGVGLAVCRRIVDRHGGTITARSNPGQGATFIVTLPATTDYHHHN